MGVYICLSQKVIYTDSDERGFYGGFVLARRGKSGSGLYLCLCLCVFVFMCKCMCECVSVRLCGGVKEESQERGVGAGRGIEGVDT